MKLLTKAIEKRLPRLYATDSIPIQDKVIVCKFFDPCSQWTWYAVEYDGEDTFFGLVRGQELKWGYFSLAELSTTKNRLGLKIERDLWFKPTRAADVPELKGKL